jgi:hypothetical protein
MIVKKAPGDVHGRLFEIRGYVDDEKTRCNAVRLKKTAILCVV